MWYTILDQDKSGTVSMHEFIDHVRALGYTNADEAYDLFMLLLLQPGSRYITMEEIKFLQSWEDTKRAQMYRKRLATSWVNKNPFLNPYATFASCKDQDEHSSMVGVDPEK